MINSFSKNSIATKLWCAECVKTTTSGSRFLGGTNKMSAIKRWDGGYELGFFSRMTGAPATENQH